MFSSSSSIISDGITNIPSDALSLAIGYGNPWMASTVCKSWKEERPGAFYEIVSYERQDPRISRIISTMMPKDGSAPRWERVYMKTRQVIIEQARIHGIPLSLGSSLRKLLDQIELAKNENLVRCFDRIREQTPEAIPPLLEGTTAIRATAIRGWMTEPENQQILDTITNLDLSYADLYALPSEIAYFTNLQKLDLEHNRLTFLPATLGQLINLQYFSLDHNQLISLPEALGQLVNLQGLFLGENRLASLPETLGQLTHLQVLHLHHNRLTSLPRTFCHLVHLQGLDLGHNRLISLSETFCHLTQLRQLKLNNNWLTSLPKTFGLLNNLQELDLGYNQIASLPDTFCRLANLKRLSLRGNPFISFPKTLEQLNKLPLLRWLNFDRNQYVSFLQRKIGRTAQGMVSSVFSVISNRLFPSFNNLQF